MDSVGELHAAEPTPALALRHRGIWRFGKLGEVPYTGNLRLLADGRIGGYFNPNETYWSVDDSGLTFMNAARHPSTRFTEAELNGEGRLVLTGAFLGKTARPFLHVLEAVPDPFRLAPAPGAFPIERHFRGARRRNLVIIGANEASLHHQWPRDIPDDARSWDIFVSFYGEAEHYPPPGPAEYTSLRRGPCGGFRKWQAIHAAMHEASPFWNYERIFIIDDDILTCWSDINRFFEICEAHDLALAAPALKPGSCIHHPITAQVPGIKLRHTSFVEALTPCFTSEALRECIPPAQESVSGFGLDQLWPLNLGFPKDRIAIVDAVAIDHTRPMATNYALREGMEEERALLGRYGVRWRLGFKVTKTVPL